MYTCVPNVENCGNLEQRLVYRTEDVGRLTTHCKACWHADSIDMMKGEHLEALLVTSNPFAYLSPNSLCRYAWTIQKITLYFSRKTTIQLSQGTVEKTIGVNIKRWNERRWTWTNSIPVKQKKAMTLSIWKAGLSARILLVTQCSLLCSLTKP